MCERGNKWWRALLAALSGAAFQTSGAAAVWLLGACRAVQGDCRALHRAAGRCRLLQVLLLPPLPSTALHCPPLPCTDLQGSTVFYPSFHILNQHFLAVHCPALHCTRLHCPALPCTALQPPALICRYQRVTPQCFPHCKLPCPRCSFDFPYLDT